MKSEKHQQMQSQRHLRSRHEQSPAISPFGLEESEPDIGVTIGVPAYVHAFSVFLECDGGKRSGSSGVRSLGCGRENLTEVRSQGFFAGARALRRHHIAFQATLEVFYDFRFLCKFNLDREGNAFWAGVAWRRSGSVNILNLLKIRNSFKSGKNLYFD